jgi:hypothetical protein
VDASCAWYDDVFALHSVPTRAADGLWWAEGPPPPWHSAVKTTRPGVAVTRVVAALAGAAGGGVADSFGDLDLRPHGLDPIIEATWLHHPGVVTVGRALPPGWSLVRTRELLAEWNEQHDYAEVLTTDVLDRPSFTILAHHEGPTLVGGAVVHRPGARRPGVVGLSNTWSSGGRAVEHDTLLEVVAALHPGQAVTDYAVGAERDAMLAAGYAALGPQVVWVPASRNG